MPDPLLFSSFPVAQLDFSSFPSPAEVQKGIDERNAAIAQAVDDKRAVMSGWIPPHLRTAQQNLADRAAMAGVPRFKLVGKSVNENVTRAGLWDCWKPALGRDYLGVHQITGSCVGAGGGNVLFSLAAADKVKRKDHSHVSIPFWLLPYGISRMLGGMNDRGEGSFGSTFGQAAGEYGHTLADEEGLPEYQEGDGIVWGGKAELDWSQGKKIPRKWLDKAKPHLVRSRAVARSTDDLRQAMQNYFPATAASDWGGLMQCPVKGEPGVLLNRRSGTWMHQMAFLGFWDHPSLGLLFFLMNQWGRRAHGICPSGAPPGGFWIVEKDADYIIRQREVIIFSQFDDFPAVDEPLDFGSF